MLITNWTNETSRHVTFTIYLQKLLSYVSLKSAIGHSCLSIASSWSARPARSADTWAEQARISEILCAVAQRRQRVHEIPELQYSEGKWKPSKPFVSNVNAAIWWLTMKNFHFSYCSKRTDRTGFCLRISNCKQLCHYWRFPLNFWAMSLHR